MKAWNELYTEHASRKMDEYWLHGGTCLLRPVTGTEELGRRTIRPDLAPPGKS